MNYCVYVHINKINGKRYVGITKQNPEVRWGKNGCNYKESPHFMSAIEKHGWENFEHEILQNHLTKEEACAMEVLLIKEWKLQDRKYGYNILEGGTAPSMPCEVRNKIAEKLKGNTNGLGHACSEEKKEKIRQAQIGTSFSDEHREKLSQAAKQRQVPCSEEKRQQLSKAYPNKKEVYCVELDKVFESVQECARELDIPATNIVKLCKGRGKTLKGYHLKYYDTINA